MGEPVVQYPDGLGGDRHQSKGGMRMNTGKKAVSVCGTAGILPVGIGTVLLIAYQCDRSGNDQPESGGFHDAEP